MSETALRFHPTIPIISLMDYCYLSRSDYIKNFKLTYLLEELFELAAGI